MPSIAGESALYGTYRDLWQRRCKAADIKRPCWLRIDVLDVPQTGSNVSVVVFPSSDALNHLDAFADQKCLGTSYEDPFVLINETLDTSDAIQLAGALSIVKSARGLSTSEALGLIVYAFVCVLDAYYSSQGQMSILFYKPARPPHTCSDDETITNQGILADQPLISISYLLNIWHRFTSVAASSILRIPGNPHGRMYFRSIPPVWLPVKQLQKLGVPVAELRNIPLYLDCDLAYLIAKQAEFLGELRRESDSHDHSVRRKLSRVPSEGEAFNPIFRGRNSIWNLSFAGKTETVQHNIGMAYIAHLLAEAEREIHVLELVDWARDFGTTIKSGDRTQVEAHLKNGELRIEDARGTGPLLDKRAKAEYRERIEKLREDLADAERIGSEDLAEKIQSELSFVLSELRKAAGLGGRDRDPNSPTERARTSVQKAITAAIKRIRTVHPELANHLERSITTGNFCRYRTVEKQRWIV